MEGVKKEFLNYLRSYYGAESMTSDTILPPVKAGPNYPAFRKESDLNALMGFGMGGPPGGGMGLMGGMGAQGGLGGMMGQQRPNPGPQRLGGPREDAQAAQQLLLGR